jgi:hypothetical protein
MRGREAVDCSRWYTLRALPDTSPSLPRELLAAFSVGFEERRYPDGAANRSCGHSDH